MRRRGLTDKTLAAWPRKPKRYIKADPELRGHYVRVPPEGPIVFTAVARDPYGKQVWATIGTELKIEQARTLAREAIRRIRKGEPAFEPPKPKPESVASVAATWLKRHVDKNQLRTGGEIRRIIDRHILPYWADRDFVSLRRSDIAALLDVLEDKHGAATADATLTVLRSLAGWVQSRNDDYTPPFTKGMRRVQVRERSRVLTDDELRRVWHAAADAGAGAFGAVVRLLLLTAQRRAKVANLRWDDISPDGVWTIRTEEREKGNADALQLPQVALDVIAAQPRFVGSPFVFATRSTTFSGRYKAIFDAQCGVTGWRLHDLRRTARSLMSRAGVLSEHAERVLGHVLGGVEGIYDRYSYAAEKADALRKLAALIERIVNPPADNVVALHEATS